MLSFVSIEITGHTQTYEFNYYFTGNNMHLSFSISLTSNKEERFGLAKTTIELTKPSMLAIVRYIEIIRANVI